LTAWTVRSACVTDAVSPNASGVEVSVDGSGSGSGLAVTVCVTVTVGAGVASPAQPERARRAAAARPMVGAVERMIPPGVVVMLVGAGSCSSAAGTEYPGQPVLAPDVHVVRVDLEALGDRADGGVLALGVGVGVGVDEQ